MQGSSDFIFIIKYYQQHAKMSLILEGFCWICGNFRTASIVQTSNIDRLYGHLIPQEEKHESLFQGIGSLLLKPLVYQESKDRENIFQITWCLVNELWYLVQSYLRMA